MAFVGVSIVMMGKSLLWTVSSTQLLFKTFSLSLVAYIIPASLPVYSKTYI